MPRSTFQFSPKGPFSLAASIRFLEGFVPAAYEPKPDAASPATLDLAFAVEGSWETVGVSVVQHTKEVVGTISAPPDPGRELRASVRVQVERILSLDVDGSGFAAVGRRDPVVAGLQRRYVGLRPVCFWSPYEAAAWAVIGQRIRIRQAATIKAAISAEHGRAVQIGDATVHAFPDPDRLGRVRTFRGLNEVKIKWLHSIARAAIDGRLDAATLRAMPRDEALDSLRELPGIGDFSAELILLRGAGDPDFAPGHEPRFERAVQHAYGLTRSPSTARLAEITDAWRPYRTWVTLLLRTQLEDDTHEIRGPARST